MSRIKIPKTREAAIAELSGLGRLIQAKKWERAAIVAAFVDVGEQGVGVSQAGKVKSDLLSPAAFAALGITGLSSKNTVQHYVENWLESRPRPEPGEEVNLDGLGPWPPRSTGIGLSQDPATQQRVEGIKAQAEQDGSGASKAVDIASNLKALGTAIKGDPATARAARKALAEVDRPPLGDSLGLSDDDGPTDGHVDEYMASEKARKDEEARGDLAGTAELVIAQRAADNLLRYGHHGALRELQAYVSGLVDSLAAAELTPEMFR